MAFEEFVQHRGRRQNLGLVAVVGSKSGYITLTPEVREKFRTDKFSHVVFHMDKENKRIAMQLVNKNDVRSDQTAYKLTPVGSGIAVKATSLLKAMNFKTPGLMKVPVAQDEETGWLVLDLKKGVNKPSNPKQATRTPHRSAAHF